MSVVNCPFSCLLQMSRSRQTGMQNTCEIVMPTLITNMLKSCIIVQHTFIYVSTFLQYSADCQFINSIVLQKENKASGTIGSMPKMLLSQLFEIHYWCSLVEAKGPLISMELFCCCLVSNHNFACTKEHHRIAQLGILTSFGFSNL